MEKIESEKQSRESQLSEEINRIAHELKTIELYHKNGGLSNYSDTDIEKIVKIIYNTAQELDKIVLQWKTDPRIEIDYEYRDGKFRNRHNEGFVNIPDGLDFLKQLGRYNLKFRDRDNIGQVDWDSLNQFIGGDLVIARERQSILDTGGSFTPKSSDFINKQPISSTSSTKQNYVVYRKPKKDTRPN